MAWRDTWTQTTPGAEDWHTFMEQHRRNTDGTDWHVVTDEEYAARKAQRAERLQALLSRHGTKLDGVDFVGGRFYVVYDKFWNSVVRGYYVEDDMDDRGVRFHVFDEPDRKRNRFMLRRQYWLHSGIPRGVYHAWQIDERHYNPNWRLHMNAEQLRFVNEELDSVADAVVAMRERYATGEPLTERGVDTVDALARAVANLRSIVVAALKEQDGDA